MSDDKALKGKRIFERFGFNAEKVKSTFLIEPKLITNFEEWEFNPKVCDWENVDSEKKLSGYKPSTQLTSILESNINTTAQ